MSKEILETADVLVSTEQGGAKTGFSLVNLVNWVLNNDVAFNTSGVGIRRAVRIEAAFAGGYPVTLQDEDWQALKSAVETPQIRVEPNQAPQAIYPLTPAKILYPLIEAIASARTT
jgi:hypothetical protein